MSDAYAIASKRLTVTLALGVVVVGAGIVVDPGAAWSGVLVAALWGVAVSVGAGIFMGVHAVSSARRWLALHEVTSTLSSTLLAPLVALALLFALGLGHVYPWAGHEGTAHLAHSKQIWLDRTFFLLRAGIIALAWLGVLANLRRALAQFVARPTREGRIALARAGALFCVVLGPTISMAFFDWGMTIEPEWSSTIYGFYGFGASFQAGIAAIAVFGLATKSAAMADADIRHRVGLFLFGFSTFWAYLWISQFLLIWYVNLPEEVPHYLARMSGDWAILFALNLVLNFVVPFVVLLMAKAKKHPAILFQVAGVVLIGRWLDFYLLVAPADGPLTSAPWAAFGALVAVVSGMGLLALRALSRTAATTTETSAPAREAVAGHSAE